MTRETRINTAEELLAGLRPVKVADLLCHTGNKAAAAISNLSLSASTCESWLRGLHCDGDQEMCIVRDEALVAIEIIQHELRLLKLKSNFDGLKALSAYRELRESVEHMALLVFPETAISIARAI